MSTMYEFSEDFNTTYTGKTALEKRVMYRLKDRYNEIPYYDGGLDISEFTYASSSDLSSAVTKVLKDMDSKVVVSGNRVLVGTVSIDTSEIL